MKKKKKLIINNDLGEDSEGKITVARTNGNIGDGLPPDEIIDEQTKDRKGWIASWLLQIIY